MRQAFMRKAYMKKAFMRKAFMRKTFTIKCEYQEYPPQNQPTCLAKSIHEESKKDHWSHSKVYFASFHGWFLPDIPAVQS